MLSTSGTLLPPRDFAERLHKSIVSAMHIAPEPDKIASIRIRALLSLHSEGLEGAEQASEHLILAIHQAHSVGLHIGRSMTDDKDESLEKLFWCLWSLDKLNAITNGRPTIIKDQDTGISITTENQEARYIPFGIWLQIATLLDEVIAFYRPAADPAATGWEHDFPSFEALMGSSSEAEVEPGVITTLELFYHAVAMLSHRARSIQDPVRATASYTRQSLAAVRATLILTRSIPGGFSPLPIVPYAISLSLAVAYRQYRQSRLTSYQERVKEEIEACCELLQSLENIWWSAGVMADLGRGALKKVNKVSKAGKVPQANSTARVEALKPVASTLLLATASGKMASYLPDHPDHHQDLVTTDFDPNGLWGPQSLDSTSPSTDVFGVPSQHPTSSERADQSVTNDLTDWMSPSFFDNFDDFLGSYPTLAFPTSVTGYEQ
ncbi:hypothetical protein B0A49_08289 [Cryomyces minteri]|uniref:Xylanolytic transcriptional activator regulatory domain-containing protein n=1 Tax=Cryomyces minteri TaxID=331657 RepID=A0A4U0WMV7_9PEZI|nr:hypothetical protein B0A49_08289 [Cryomyces minteri]